MSTALQSVRRTRPLKHVLIARLIAGFPLLGLNIMHLIGAAPLRPILDAANIPMPGINTILAPVLGVLAGLLLLSGAFARIGAAIGAR